MSSPPGLHFRASADAEVGRGLVWAAVRGLDPEGRVVPGSRVGVGRRVSLFFVPGAWSIRLSARWIFT